MALIQNLSPHRSAALGRGAAWPSLLYVGVVGAGLLALFLLTRPYAGILHDARLYVGFALAGLYPDGIGQDMVLAETSQSGFTVFPMIIGAAVRTFGPALGAELVALAGLLLWFGAAAALATAFSRGRTCWVVLVFVTVLPAWYGAYQVFGYAEPLTVPRPYAEAFVLFALALVVRGRKAAALVPLGAAVLLHPLAALPGIAVYGWLLLVDPHERVLRPKVSAGVLALACIVLVAAAALGAPLADRLFTQIDEAWRAVLMARSPYLFIGAWPLDAWTQLIVQAATVAIVASLVTGRARSLFVAVLGVGVGGVLASLVLGDGLGSLLIVQLQLWRATWLLAVFAAAGLGLCAVTLWRRDALSRVILGVLVLAWIEQDLPGVAIGAALLALALTYLPLPTRIDFDLVGKAVWALVALCAAIFFGMHVYGLWLLLSAMPDGAANGLDLARSLDVLAIPVCLLAVLWANAGEGPRAVAATVAVSLSLIVSAATLWDGRPAWQAMVDAFRPDAGLQARIASRPGAVLWIGDGFATWSQTGRPNWSSRLQGASNVFSRELAMRWDERSRFLAETGMVDKRLRTPFDTDGRLSNAEPSLTSLSDAQLERLCARPDAPAWLIAPASLVRQGRLSDRWERFPWTVPHGEYAFLWDGSGVKWTAVRDFAVVACASRG